MFALGSHNEFYCYSNPTDMRRGFNSLSGIIHSTTSEGLSLTKIFVFLNKKRDKIKLLHWTGAGFVLYYKRLEKGVFKLPEYDVTDCFIKLTYTELILIIDGISVVNILKNKRYLR